MAPVMIGPEDPRGNRRDRVDWPTLLAEIPLDGNWYHVDEIEFTTVVKLKNAYQYVKRVYGHDFEVQTQTRAGLLRLLVKRKVS